MSLFKKKKVTCICPCCICMNYANCEIVNKKRQPGMQERIYKALDTAEKIAITAAQIHQIIKKSKKRKKKKNKKLYKIDKKTGTLLLKKPKKIKVQKQMKRYKAPKKKSFF